MGKDYKDDGRKRGGGGTPGFIWMLGGFALGVVVTVLYRVGTPLGVPPTRHAVEVPDRGAPAASTPTKLDFYGMLENFQVVVPGQLKPEQGKPGTGPAAPADSIFVLQVGAFRTAPEADRLRAQLALLGIEARIQKAVIDDKDSWFRVRVGPVKDADELAKLRQRLDENNVKYLLLRGSA